MGQFRIELTAVGGHGCQRDTVKNGDTLAVYCGEKYCPDCATRRFLDDLRVRQCSVESATLTHWPGQSGEVKDDLVTGIRTGSILT